MVSAVPLPSKRAGELRFTGLRRGISLDLSANAILFEVHKLN